MNASYGPSLRPDSCSRPSFRPSTAARRWESESGDWTLQRLREPARGAPGAPAGGAGKSLVLLARPPGLTPTPPGQVLRGSRQLGLRHRDPLEAAAQLT